jgi:hypothetical protein
MSSPEDRLVWTIEAAKAGTYEVEIEWAQIDANDGNRFQLEVAGRKLEGRFATTGDWANYRRASFGKLELAAGKQQLTLRPVGEVKSELADLRAIKLTPR